MAVLVKEVMIKNPVTISNKATLGEAVEMFAHKEIGCMPMLDENGRLVAMLTDGDVVYYVVSELRLMKTLGANFRERFPDPKCHNYFTMLLKNCTHEPAYEAATHHVITINEDENVRKAAELMYKKSLEDIPVVDEDKNLVGVITRNDIIQGIFHDYLEDPDAVCVEGY